MTAEEPIRPTKCALCGSKSGSNWVECRPCARTSHAADAATIREQAERGEERARQLTQRAVQVHLELEHKHATESAELRARCERYEDLILLDEKRAEAGLAHYYRSGADGKCECVVCAEARAIRARREAGKP